MRSRWVKGLWLGVASGLLFTMGEQALARTEGKSDYTKAQTYSAALRYVRVDLGYEIIEKDPDAAYLLFRYSGTSGKNPSTGSIEIVEVEEHVKIIVQLPRWPEYHEKVLRDGLLKKLKEEYGTPTRRMPPPPKRDLDAGTDSQ